MEKRSRSMGVDAAGPRHGHRSGGMAEGRGGVSGRGAASGPGIGGGRSNNTALTAVALQDHYVKSLALNLNLTNPWGAAGGKAGTGRTSRPPKPKQTKSIVSSRSGVTTKPTKEPIAANRKALEKKEYVLDQPKPPPMTLAQKMGLVSVSGDAPLTEDDWKMIKAKSNEREDSKQPCVICKEDFDTREQVLLSCSHVFHKNCIQAFEKFAGKKSCPMCRKERYQTRVIYEGSVQYQHKCATRIQALWRGHVVKSWYKKLRETVPPNDPILRKKFYEQKLQDITDRMVQSLDSDVDGFLRDLDQSLAASRDVFRRLDDAVLVVTDDEWDEIQLQAVKRGCVDCPICLTALESKGLVAQCEKTVPKKVNAKNNAKKDISGNEQDDKHVQKSSTRRTILLSCSHVFHQTCLEAFEGFAVGERSNVCPVCRSHYQKKMI